MIDTDLKNRFNFFKDITYKYNLVYPSDYLYIGQETKWNLVTMINYWRYFLYKEKDPFLYLYFHLPFCYKSRCAYCDNDTTVLRDENDLKTYLSYLSKMISIYSKLFSANEFKALYIGGGTPSILSEVQIEYLLKKINKNFKFNEKGLRTMEMSPVTASYKKIDICKRYGISRLSMGVQTLNCNILEKISRFGNLSINPLRDLLNYVINKKFDDFNIDLIVGLPDESEDSFLQNLKEILKIGVPSITIYKYIHNYKFEKDKNKPQYYVNKHLDSFPRLYKKVIELMVDFDYIEETKNSEIMNLYRYVKKGHTDKLDYYPQWNIKMNNSVLGIGRGAENFIQNQVFAIEEFCLDRNKLNLSNTHYEGFRFSKDDQIRNYVILELWRYREINNLFFKKIFACDFFDYFNAEIEFLLSKNKAEIKDDIFIFKNKDILDFSIYIKYFFNYNYLLNNYLNRQNG